MNKTAIEWCDMTWNPVTGCLHGCAYCYARRIADRFGLSYAPKLGDPGMEGACKYDGPEGIDTMLELEKPYRKNGYPEERVQPFPMGFAPTLHRYRLDEPKRREKSQTIFVCSMADLFGSWVPDSWIEAVFAACEKAPQHRYLFLTKNPDRYTELALADKLPIRENFWYGSTATDPDMTFWWSEAHNTFASFEPLLAPFEPVEDGGTHRINWAIIGAMTGPGASEYRPKKEWVDTIVGEAHAAGIPVFMKDSLLPIVGEAGMRREFPWAREEAVT